MTNPAIFLQGGKQRERSAQQPLDGCRAYQPQRFLLAQWEETSNVVHFPIRQDHCRYGAAANFFAAWRQWWERGKLRNQVRRRIKQQPAFSVIGNYGRRLGSQPPPFSGGTAIETVTVPLRYSTSRRRTEDANLHACRKAILCAGATSCSRWKRLIRRLPRNQSLPCREQSLQTQVLSSSYNLTEQISLQRLPRLAGFSRGFFWRDHFPAKRQENHVRVGTPGGVNVWSCSGIFFSLDTVSVRAAWPRAGSE